jgi:hydroxymethylglutaryl-CoA lyase
MSDQVKIPVKIIECPRDAWQGLSAHIPAEAKAAFLRKLIDAGFTHIDAVSFVSPAAVPQMADSEEVLTLLNPPPSVEIIGIVVNEKGAERAIQTGRVQALGFPYSISPEFLRRNQRQTQAEAMNTLQAIATQAHEAKLNIVAYISMAFGNPYNDPWSPNTVIDACGSLIEAGIRQISFADTVGAATSDQIAEVVRAVLAAHSETDIGVHLHARRDEAAAHIHAAWDAGCRRFDAAIGGLGGCPFAQDDLVANIPTEILIEELQRCGAALPQLAPLDDLIRISAELAKGSEAATH